MTEFLTKEGLIKLRDGKLHIYVIGNGSKLGFDTEDLQQSCITVNSYIKALENWYGVSATIIYGGDPFMPKADIAHVVQYLATTNINRTVVAIQCEEYASYMQDADKAREYYSFVKKAYIYPTERSRDGKIIFGGYNPETGVPAGTTNIVVDLYNNHGFNMTTICVGEGGPITIDERDIMYNENIPLIHISCDPDQ